MRTFFGRGHKWGGEVLFGSRFEEMEGRLYRVIRGINHLSHPLQLELISRGLCDFGQEPFKAAQDPEVFCAAFLRDLVEKGLCKGVGVLLQSS